MKVRVSERAKYNRNKVADYILREFGERTLSNFRQAYKDAKRFIAEHPNGGTDADYISDKRYKYQFTVINGLSIMLYRIEGDIVYVVDFWDTRQQPPTIVRV